MNKIRFFLTQDEEKIKIELLNEVGIKELGELNTSYISKEIFRYHDVYIKQNSLFFITKKKYRVSTDSFIIKVNDFEKYKLDIGLTESYYIEDNEKLKNNIDYNSLKTYYDDTEILKNRMSKLLEMDKSELDFSPESLSNVSNKIALFAYNDIFYSKMYPIITVYLGKTIEKNTQIHFGIFREESQWIPYLRDKNDDEIKSIVKDYLLEVDFWSKNLPDSDSEELRLKYDYLAR